LESAMALEETTMRMKARMALHQQEGLSR